MPSSIRVAVCASLLVSAAACQKAEFDKPQPQALVVTLSSGLISADDGTISVSVAAVEDGSPVLNESVTATIGGACAAAPQTLDTSPTSGLAVFDFTGLDSAGGCTVTVTARALTEVANFEVAAGAPATIALAAVGATAIQAGESVGYSVVINDAAANDVSVGVSITTDAPGSINNADGTIDFTIAGSWQVFAQVIGFPALTGPDSFAVTVTAAGAAQVTTTLAQSSVGQQQTLDLTCAQFDAFGNLIANNFTAADVSTNPAASTVVEDINTPNLFHISGFPTFGIFVATCDAGALFDDETFSVEQQAGASSAIATADLAQIEAGTGVISVTCREVDGFGNDLGSTFDVGTGFTTTAVGTVSEPSPNLFTVTGVAATGSFSATCISATDTDSENFAVVDSTAPAVQAFSVSGGTGPHPAGTIVSVNLDVTDVIGVATESLIISGPGAIVSSPTLFETTADPPSRSFQVRLNGSTGVSTTVTVQGQAADTTGNLRVTSTISITVNATPTLTTATVSTSNVEAGSTLVVTCNEVSAVTGSSASTNFAAANVSTTAAGETIVEQGGAPNNFDVTGLLTKGTFVATCAGVGDSGDATFAVVDTTPPSQDAFSVSGGTGPYAAGTTVTVNLDVQDLVGVASESLVIVSGPGVVTSPSTILETTANPASRTFQVRLEGTVGSASTVTVRGQAADTTGNLLVTSTIAITVNAAPTVTNVLLSTANVEAGSTLVVTCNETNAITGSSANTNFAAANVTTTAVGETIVEQGGSPNSFDVTGLLTRGTFVATCAGVADSGDATFAVVDTTPPTQDAFSVTGGTGPYVAGTTVTVNLDVQDLVGVASESLVIVSGPGVITSPSTILETTANPPSRTFQVRLEGTVGSASTVTVRGQAADTTGNLLTTSTIAITVNAAPTTTTAMVSVESVEAGSTLVVTCNEFNAVTGSSANTNFAAGNVSTTAVGEGIAETTPTSNVFNVTALLTKGTFVATCTGAGSSGNATFAVVDTTPPTLDAFSVTGGNGPYAAGTVVTVNLDVQDLVGVASESLVIASGPGVITSPSTVLESTTNPPSRSFQVRLDGSVGAASTVTVQGQAADTTGNLLTTSTIAISVNAIVTSVVTTLAGTSIQYDQTLDLTCKQVNSTTGADTGTVFVVGDVSSTAPGLSSVTSLGGNAFRLTGPFTAKGNFTATCTKSAQSNVKTFAIFDATAPSVGTLSVFAATGVNGITGDARYAPGTVVTVRLSTASDTIGLAQVDVSAIGTAAVNPATRFVSGTSATNIDFDVTVGASAATFSTIVITAQASDTTGNTSAASGSLTLTVDPAVALTAASGVTIRTLFETNTGAYPAGLGTDGTNLFVQRRDPTTGFISDVVRIAGTSGPATLSNFINAGFPASTFASGGITAAPAGFGSPTLRTVFHTFGSPNPQIGAENGTSHTRFDSGTSPVDPTDVVFGDIGPGGRVFTIDRDAGTGGFTTVLKSINTGGTVPYFQTTGSGDTIGGAAPNMTLTDAGASFTLADVGQSISIGGAANFANNGTFVISGFTDSTTITYQNGSGVAEGFPGAWAISTRIEDCRALTRDASLSRLLIADPSGTSGGASGAIHALTDTGGDVPNPITSLTLSGSIPANDASDIATSPTKIVIAGGATGAVYRVITATSTVETPVSVDFDLPIGLAVKSADANSLHVLDAGAVPGGWRIYKVTGY